MTRKLPKRNDPCWCNSGKKYKKCHLRSDERGETTPPGVATKQVAKPTVVAGSISPRRQVPDSIIAPEYAKTGAAGGRGPSCKKESEEEISRMRRAGTVAREVLDAVLAAV